MNCLYLSGKMTGLPDFGYPLFNAEAARLRALGYTVANPAEGPVCDSWEAYMRNALRMMLDCDSVAFLPNWHDSRGARIEYQLAKDLSMDRVMAADVVERAAI